MSDIPSELRNGTAWWMSDRDIRYAAADEIERLRAQNAALREALQSIAANTCCNPCQEAVLVARAALKTGGKDE